MFRQAPSRSYSCACKLDNDARLRPIGTGVLTEVEHRDHVAVGAEQAPRLRLASDGCIREGAAGRADAGLPGSAHRQSELFSRYLRAEHDRATSAVLRSLEADRHRLRGAIKVSLEPTLGAARKVGDDC